MHLQIPVLLAELIESVLLVQREVADVLLVEPVTGARLRHVTRRLRGRSLQARAIRDGLIWLVKTADAGLNRVVRRVNVVDRGRQLDETRRIILHAL